MNKSALTAWLPTGWMSRVRWPQLTWGPGVVVVLLAVVVFWTNLGGSRLFDEDEPKNAACGQEMYLRGDWIVPTFNQELRTDKPILLYWLMLTSFSALGVSEFAARVPSALLSVGTVLMTYHLGRRLYSRETGLFAGTILATSLMFVTVSRAATPDATLIFCTTGAFTAFVFALSGTAGDARLQRRSSDPASRWPAQLLPRHWSGHVAMFAMMSLAVLAKGPVGVVLPAAVIGLFLLLVQPVENRWAPRWYFPGWLGTFCTRFDPRLVWTTARKLRPEWLLATVLIIALPWYIAVGIRTNGAWLAGFLGDHNVGRFLTPMERHSGPFYYYIPVICVGFFPWSVLIIGTFWQAIAAVRSTRTDRVATLFLLTWVGTYLLFFSCAQTKLPNYVLPCYPALALLTGALLAAWQEQRLLLPQRLMAWGPYTLVVCGAVMAIAGVSAGLILERTLFALVPVALIPVAGGLGAVYLSRRGVRDAVLALSTAAVVFVTATWVFVVPVVSGSQDGPRIAELLRSQNRTGGHVATYNYFAPNLVFYTAGRIDRLREADHVAAYLARYPDAVVILPEREYEEISFLLPESMAVISRCPRFLRGEELLILAHDELRISTASGDAPVRR